MWLYAVTIFLSAFLLFQIQPLIGKWILPWVAGGPAVWTTCMLFFQTALLGGYAYAHLLRTHLKERGQLVVHLGLLSAATIVVAVLRVTPLDSLKPVGGQDPTWQVLLILATAVGLPYFALSATSPLAQAWFSASFPGKSPYRLYALSNVGSLLALATYPLLVEPTLRLRMQGWMWSAGFLTFAFLCGVCAIIASRASSAATPAAPAEVAEADAPRPRLASRLLWLALPACGSIMLLAVTNQMCADVGVVPFLWVLPLGLYLLSFILVFDSDRVYWRPVFWPALFVVAGGILWLLAKNIHAPIEYQVVGFSIAMFVCCMVCHGELARLRPAPRYLTSYFLHSSAGGAIGGLFVILVAMRVFPGYFELHIGLLGSFILAVLAFLNEKPLRVRCPRATVQRLFAIDSVSVPVILAVLLAIDAREETREAVSISRNFYGVLLVQEYYPTSERDHYFSLQHGRILHGKQYTSEALRYTAITYYGANSGVGRAVRSREGPMRIGVVGLGTGTMAAWGGRGDVVRFYEINPAVRNLAMSRFTYLTDSKAACEIVMGDARLSLEREDPQGYDVLALDAFTSDAIPVHLLTREAVEVYRKHLKPDGILAIHISNRYLNLEPVALALADYFKMEAVVIDDANEVWPLDASGNAFDVTAMDAFSSSNWVLLSNDKRALERPSISDGASTKTAKRRLWTDDYSDLFSVVRWKSSDE